MTRLARLAGLLALVVTLTTGCAINRATATVEPDAKLESIKSVYVVKQPADERGVDKLLVDNLRQRGLTVATGAAKPAGGYDALVTYVDKWMWDITMYMLELTVTFRDPKTEFPLAVGNSYHTSLTRLEPPKMVDEVIGNIYKEGKKK